MDDRALVTYAVPFGAIAQLVERFHGMEEVRSSILLSSTSNCKGFVKSGEHAKRLYARRYALTVRKPAFRGPRTAKYGIAENTITRSTHVHV
jgi:hypothetical protein